MNPRVAAQSVEQLRDYLRLGNPGAGMPPFADLPAADLLTLARYLRHLNANTILHPVAAVAPSRKVRFGPPQRGDWASYNGDDSGNRYSPLKQITTANVRSLRLQWVFPIPYFGLEVTPLAADGVLYVTGPNQVYALDALTGQMIWQYSRPASPGMVGDAKLGTNRGVALLRDKVFFVTDNAHLLALDRATGQLVWDVPMAPVTEEQHHYGGTCAPLVVDGMVIAGVAGADEGIRGFVAAYRPEDGAVVWRHWTVPRRGEPGIETWQGKEPTHGGGSTWLTGSYDAATDTLYWATGNPWPDGDDRDRPGDNLYTNCVLALRAKTGGVAVALPVHAARCEGSRCDGAECAGGYGVWRPAQEVVAACRPQRVLLCAGPDERPSPAGQAVPAPSGLGQFDRRRWAAGGGGAARMPE